MSRTAFGLALAIAIGCADTLRAGIDGSVFLFPIEQNGSFASHAEAVYVNVLQVVDPSAVLGGTHSVHGPQIFTHAVTGNGRYQYVLEGPTVPSACYGTTLQVTADPPGPFNDQTVTFTGDTKCAPARTCVDANGNGLCDSQEPLDKDPNEDSCPGGPPCSSPILVNLRAGPYSLSGADDAVEFDIDADGTPNRITWTAAGSAVAFLAMDRNANAQIDNGAELFGNWTVSRTGARAANGFEALKELDSNGDGIVDSRDDRWSALLLWADANHDGVSQPMELQSVNDSTVRALETAYHWTGRRDAFDNFFGYQGMAYLSHGRRQIYDVYFRSVQ